MTVDFFPRDKTFWLYHCGVLSVVGISQIVAIVLWRPNLAFNLIGNFLWFPLLTLAVLYYRWQYKRGLWHLWSAITTLGFGLFYCLASGFAVSIIMLGIIVPLFWHEIVALEPVTSGQITTTSVVVQLVVSNGLQTALFICAWIFVYISITSKRRIREAELTNLRLQNSLREAQLSHLNAQLNPHFLFNALNNIRFMIHENPQNAENMVISLSDMLRYSLEGNKKEKVRLGQELDTIERYLALMRVQLEQRLRVEMDIPANLKNYLVPPMMLQMLVENAIKHGLDNRREGGRLQLSAALNGDKLKLVVSNDAAETTADVDRKLGIGLSNIQQRLHLLYGDQAQLDSNSDAQTFSVSVQLPGEREA
jgi:sensor histidine kinase YesM